MSWRYFIALSKDGTGGHTLDCGHLAAPKLRKGDNLPVSRRWCKECWKTEGWKQPENITLEMPTDIVKWLQDHLEGALPGMPAAEVDMASRVLLRLRQSTID